MKSSFIIYPIAFILIGFISCRKFVEIPPPATELVGASAYNTNATASSAVTGIYLTMANPGSSIGGSINYRISALLGLSADEFLLFPNSDIILNQTYANSLTSANPPPEWSDFYNCIYQANSAIENISASTGLDSSIKRQLLGEAEFIRAFCNFYLVNIYGDIPLISTTNYLVNEAIARTSQKQVYQQIVADLKKAQALLGSDFLNPDGSLSSERVRPNNGAATALLARTYLYEQKWDSAEAQASALINNPIYQLNTNLASVFLANSSESIWQLEPPDNGFDAPDGAFLIGFLYFGGPNTIAPFTLSNSLMESFEPGDLRRVNWIDSIIAVPSTYYFPYKYTFYYTGNPSVQYPTIFRLAEQYLIRAEARAHQGNIAGAQLDLDVIRVRAGLANTKANDQSSLLTAILHERQVELFTECGHRWFDLKRTGNLNSVMSMATPQKGGVWVPTDSLYPIPLSEILSDNKLIQNPGY